MFYKDSFAQRLAILRRDKKLSLQQLGDAVGKTNQAISLLEKGRGLPSFEVLCQLADYFDVSLDYLVGRSDNPMRREICYNSTKGVIRMTTATIEREEIVRRVRSLPDEKLPAVLLFIEDLEGHEPNEETIRAIQESLDPANLVGPFNSIEALMESLLSDDDA